MVGPPFAGGNIHYLERPPGPSIAGAVARMVAAAEQGHDFLLAEAALLFKSVERTAQLMVRAGGLWQEWNGRDDDAAAPPGQCDALELAVSDDAIVVRPESHVFPIDPTGVALLVETSAIDAAGMEFLTTACKIVRLSLRSCEGTFGDPDRLDAIKAYQKIASRILKSQNLTELFQQITIQAKRRLAADICGILLLQDDVLVMQRCVGNWVVETENLQMRVGQGVAGRVLEKGSPCTIEDYINSSDISPDFFHLARAERVRSALAVPLQLHDETLGVLEVWRRKPSRFTPQHCAELGALADLTSLAINNVRLTQARQDATSRLEAAHRELSCRYNVIRRSADLQEALIATHLAGSKLQDIIERASLTLGVTVAYFDRLMTLQACHPPRAIGEAASRQIKTQFSLDGTVHDCRQKIADKLEFVSRPVVAATEHLGWIVLRRPKSDCDELQLALYEICVTAALHIMKETAATRALTDKIATLTSDLLDSPAGLRAVALERIKECGGIELKGDLYLFACRIEDAKEDAPGRASALLESQRQKLVALVADIRDSHREIKLFALRGAELGIIATIKTAARAQQVADKLIVDVLRDMPGVSCTIGISRAVRDPMQIGDAWKDARRAQRVARQLGPNRALGLSQTGVAGLLIGLQEGADFRDFVEDQIGKICEEDAGQRETLLRTLRTYFSSGCCRQDTALSLGIHPKTLVYRLKKIERITGLNLDHHGDRVLLDLALRMDQLLA